LDFGEAGVAVSYPPQLETWAPAIARVLERWPETSVADVLRAVADGTAQLFAVNGDGVIVTRLVQEPGRLVCLVWLASGDLEPLLERYVDIEAWAAREGAVAMRIQGRAGWLRVLPGYKQTGVILEKELV
jgi:NADPH-dependent ferric siderophore reductase